MIKRILQILPLIGLLTRCDPLHAAAPANGDIILNQSNGSGPSTIRVIPATAGTLPTGVFMHSGSNVFASGTVPLGMGGTGETSVGAAVQAFLNAISTTQGAILYRGASSWTALSPGTNGQVLRTNGAAANPSWATVSGTGTVTSVAASGPSGILSWSAAITTAGTLTATLDNQSANTVLAGPTTGAAATPAFRALVAADIPDLTATYQAVDAVAINVKNAPYNATGDARKVTDAVTNGTTTVTSATANFTSGDVGKAIYAVQAGSSVVYLPRTTIVSLNSSTSIEVASAAIGSASGLQLVCGTDDTDAIQAAVTAAKESPSKAVYLPSGGYLFDELIFDMTSAVGDTPVPAVIGDGSANTIFYAAPDHDTVGGALFYAADGNTLYARVSGVAVDGCDIDFGAGADQIMACGSYFDTLLNDVRLEHFKGTTSGVYAYGYFSRLRNVYVESVGGYGIASVAASSMECMECISANCTVNSVYVNGTDGDLNTKSYFRWTGGWMDESNSGSLAIVNANDVVFSHARIHGPVGGNAATVDGTSIAQFIGCEITPWGTSGDRGGISVASGGLVYLDACRVDGAGTADSLTNAGTVYASQTRIAGSGADAIVNSGTVYDCGGNTFGSVSGSAPISGLNIAASNVTSGTIATARLGSGVADSTTYLRGDSTWQTISTGITIDSTAITGGTVGNLIYHKTGNVVGEATTGTGVLTAIGNAVDAASGLLTYGMIGTSGTKLGLLNTANNFSATQTITTTNPTVQLKLVGYGNNIYIYDDDGTTLRAWTGGGRWYGADFNTRDNTASLGGPSGNGLRLCNTYPVAWSSDGTWYGTADAFINRDGAAGIFKFSGTSADAKLRAYNNGATKYAQFTHDGTDAIVSASSGGIKIGSGGTAISKIKHGTATLSSGAATVSDSDVAAGSRIFVNRQSDGGTLGDSFSIVISAGSQFTITAKTANATASSDTSTVSWIMINP